MSDARATARNSRTRAHPVQNPDYWDWRFGATKSFADSSGAFRIGAFYSQAGNRSFYDNTQSLLNGATRDLGRPAFIVEISRTFLGPASNLFSAGTTTRKRPR